MKTGRREFLLAAAALGTVPASNAQTGAKPMRGLIGKMNAVAGKRDELISILLEGTGGMPGCLSYIVSKDAADPSGIWITEVWDSKESHQGSLSLPAVRAAIAKAKPLIAGFEKGVTTEPIGGIGLPSRA